MIDFNPIGLGHHFNKKLQAEIYLEQFNASWTETEPQVLSSESKNILEVLFPILVSDGETNEVANNSS